MKVVDFLQSRRQQWQQLEILCRRMEKRKDRRSSARRIGHFATLYRSACADLALADAYHLPPDTVNYLHQLVGRAHNQLYRSRMFNFRAWGEEMFVKVPQHFFNDNCLRLAFVLFYGFFIASMYLASDYSPIDNFAEKFVGADMVQQMETMYDNPITAGTVSGDSSAAGAGFYQNHNTTIGLRCFAAGLLFGFGGLFETIFNAAYLGTIFGHMTTIPQNKNFFEFVTAHGPFELTAIVLSAATGMRLGFSLVDTKGLNRIDSVRRAGVTAMPCAFAAIILFALAAIIEGFISPSGAPYLVKAVVCTMSCIVLMVYFVLLGLPRENDSTT